MREITDHKHNLFDDAVKILVTDEPGPGRANHRYQLLIAREEDVSFASEMLVRFQEGAIGDVGVNGVSNEALLAVLIDRLRGFQSGEFKCRENAIALTHLEEALMWLHKRTTERLTRGVEGQYKP